MSRFTLDTSEFRGKLRDIINEIKRQADDQLRAEAETVLAKSQQLVPVDTGALKASGKVTKDQQTGSYVVSYGDDRTDAYALIQHEDLTLNHPRGGQAKFLEQPALEQFDGAAGPLGKRVEAVVSKHRVA